MSAPAKQVLITLALTVHASAANPPVPAQLGQQDVPSGTADRVAAPGCSPQTWNREALLSAPVPTADDLFGSAVALQGDTALVGAPSDDEPTRDAGAAFVIAFDGISWVHSTKLLPPDGETGDQFGYSVALDGNIAVIGAPTHNAGGPNAGAVYLYREIAGVWTFEAKLLSDDIEPFDEFGFALDISGERLIVGAHRSDDLGSQAGSAYIYDFDAASGQWLHSAKLLAADGGAGHRHGFAVAIDNDLAVVGAPAWRDPTTGEDNGAAYVYRRDSISGAWQEEAIINTSHPDGDQFAISVDVEVDRIAVGSRSPIANLYRYDGLVWEPEFEFDLGGRSSGALALRWRTAVELEGNRFVIGHGYWSAGYSRRLIRLFEFDGAAWDARSDAITRIPTIGNALAISGDRLVAGAVRPVGPPRVLVFEVGPPGDCNGNGIADYCDFEAGLESDCDRNDIPDACDVATGSVADCNGNGMPDACEVAASPVPGTPPDCNDNEIPDECEVADGTIVDCDANGVPDVCETDCNGNGVGDACDLADATSPDCNGNGVPDECDFDCDANGIPDACDLTADPALDADGNGVIDVCECPVQRKLIPLSPGAPEQFGYNVDINDDLAIVGALWEDTIAGPGAGAVYIYRRHGLDWVQEARLVDPEGGEGHGFGNVVAICDDLAVVGQPRRGEWCSGNEAVFIYRFDPASRQWNLEQLLERNDPQEPNPCAYGVNVDVDRGRIAVFGTAFDEINDEFVAGYALIYERDPGSGWRETARLPATLAPTQYTWLPPSWMHLDGDRLMVGAPGQGIGANGINRGTVFLHRFDGDSWVEEAQLFSDTDDPEDLFGYSVDFDGDLAIVGAAWNSELREEEGAAYIFGHTGTEWLLEEKLRPPPGFEVRSFGSGVAIESDTVAVTGTTGRQGLALFLYRRDPGDGEWTFDRRVLAYDGAFHTGFNFVIDSADGQVIVSARGDDELAPNAGAVYVLSGLFGPDCDENLEPDACDIHFGRAQDINANVVPDACERFGDVDGDGIVDVEDLLALLATWGDCLNCPADFDGSGRIDVFDLLTLFANWG